MAHWALIFFLFGGQYSDSPATGTVPGFTSEALCRSAARQINSKDWYCVQTDGEAAAPPR